ncbi:dsDNA nuclease domain-containing protein [Paracoccus cavernae]|uniref:dsDNA nuclease domain-containing protein n=1 Tax=Paracoccus cavernae TaxID=1571207 RepID=UPI0035F3D2F8
MGVKEFLTCVPEREKGGQTALDRFDYQTAWGVSRLLDLHEKGSNYAVAFEFHDDIVALDDADEPSSAIFYQVKTRETGNWSFAKITHRPSSKGIKKSSFAGKMFDNCVRFGATVERLVFVSNQPLPEVIVAHGEEKFSSAEKAKLEKFVKAISEEVDGYDDGVHNVLFFFVFSDLNLTNYQNTVIGRIAEFLESELGSDIPPKTFALALNDFCRTRSKALADLGNFEALKASKFVTRANMMKWLTQAQDHHSHRPDWKTASDDLTVPFKEKVGIQASWREYEMLVRSRTNAATVAFTQELHDVVYAGVDQADDKMHLLDIVFIEAKNLVAEWHPGASDFLVKAAILYELQR